MFLGELEEILELINMVEFQSIMVPLFWRTRCCINSFHFQVQLLSYAKSVWWNLVIICFVLCYFSNKNWIDAL